jgi:hypothetical protein
MHRLFAVLLVVAPAIVPGCAPPTAEVVLARPFAVVPVAKSTDALARVVAAVRAAGPGEIEVFEDEFGGGDRIEVYPRSLRREALAGFLQAHPELAPPAGTRFGYERVADADRMYWRLLGLEEGGLTVERVVSAELKDDPDFGLPQIRVHLGPEDARRFGELTTKLQGQRIAIVQGDEVLASPIVKEPITAGKLSISSGMGSRADIEATLEQLLGR